MASIQKIRKGVYRVRVYYYDENGKRKTISKNIEGAENAKSYARSIESNLKEIRKQSNSPILKEYLEKYIELFRVNKVSDNTLQIDLDSLKRIFFKKEYNKLFDGYDSSIRLNELTVANHQEFINRMVESGYDITTIKKTNSLLYRALKKASLDGYITINVAEHIEYGIKKDVDKKAKFLNTEEIIPFLDDVKRRNQIHYYLFRTIIETGMRVGEACALTYEDINFDEKYISVYKSYDQKRDKLGPTKTGNERVIFISSSLINELLKLKLIDDTNRSVNNDSYNNFYNFIFVDGLGTPLKRSTIHNTMTYCSNKVLGKQMSVHKLRHTHASILLEAGVPMKVISERLGHQTMTMTDKVYAHVTPKLNIAAMDQYNRYISSVFTD